MSAVLGSLMLTAMGSGQFSCESTGPAVPGVKAFGFFYTAIQIVVPVQIVSSSWYKIALYYPNKHN